MNPPSAESISAPQGLWSLKVRHQRVRGNPMCLGTHINKPGSTQQILQGLRGLMWVSKDKDAKDD